MALANFTYDVDVGILPDERNARALLAALTDFGFAQVGLDVGDFLKPASSRIRDVAAAGSRPIRGELRHWRHGHKIMAMARPANTKTTVGSAEFKSRCLELVDRVKETRAEFIVTRHGRPVAKLVPADAVHPVSLVGSMANSVVHYEGPFDPIPAVWTLDTHEDEG